LRFGFLSLFDNSVNIITSLGKLFLPNQDFSWLQLGREGFKKVMDKVLVATKNSRHISLPGSDVLVDGPSDLSEPCGEPLLGRDGRRSKELSKDDLDNNLAQMTAESSCRLDLHKM
jgi:hypothetical protein